MAIRNYLIVFSCALGAAAYAEQDPLACIDQDIRDAFFSFAGKGQIEQRLPSWLELSFDESFSLIGSANFGSSGTVALKTQIQPAAARSRLKDWLGQAGWENLADQQDDLTGFRAPRLRTDGYLMLCHQDHGTVTVSAQQRQNDTITWLRRSGSGNSCQQQKSMLNTITEGRTISHLPALDLPDDIRNHRGSSSSSSGDSEEISTRFESNATPHDLLGHFADQLKQQGWTADTNWQGSVTAGSAWTKTNLDDQLLSGLLRVDIGTKNAYQVTFGLSLVQ